jgi:hypothetical protein
LVRAGDTTEGQHHHHHRHSCRISRMHNSQRKRESIAQPWRVISIKLYTFLLAVKWKKNRPIECFPRDLTTKLAASEHTGNTFASQSRCARNPVAPPLRSTPCFSSREHAVASKSPAFATIITAFGVGKSLSPAKTKQVLLGFLYFIYFLIGRIKLYILAIPKKAANK